MSKIYDMDILEEDLSNYNPYEVRLDFILENIREEKQLAYAVNTEAFNIIISKSGHDKIMRKSGLNKHSFSGGWIFLKQEKITFYSGSLGKVKPKHRKLIVDAVCNALKMHLRIVN